MITFIGTVVVIIAEIALLTHDLSLSKDVPGWRLVYYAISIVVYQTMDTLDGIHARNHRMSSPLGQLFDAGIDAPLHGFLETAHLQAIKAGNSMIGYLYLVSLIVFSFTTLS